MQDFKGLMDIDWQILWLVFI